MRFLELKIPPPIVALTLGALMYLSTESIAGITGRSTIEQGLFWLLLIVAGLLDGSGVLNFLRHHTTINPWTPQKSSELVTTGVYRFSRNPMYLGLALLLTDLSLYLESWIALVGPVLFVAYITRFQIIPEERFLMDKFGGAYQEYKLRVRRWI